MVTISVVMPVYNTPVPFLKEAVDSILNQTFGDFEFIIIDDGSPSDTKRYLDSLTDPRIRLIHNETNLGITRSLNIGFRAAQGKYIARMDGDDVSLPERFEKQAAFMESNPNVIACGASAVKYGQSLPSVSMDAATMRFESMDNYKVRLLFVNPGPIHPTAFFRRAILLQNQVLYDEQLVYSQDYGMWMSLCNYGQICSLPDVLLIRRKHDNQITKIHREKQIDCDKITQRRVISSLIDNVTEEDLDLHYYHSTGYYPNAMISPQIVKWYNRLLRANKKKKVFSQKLLKKRIERIKSRLVYQTIGTDASGIKKAYYYLRYMSLETILRSIRDGIKSGLNRFRRY